MPVHKGGRNGCKVYGRNKVKCERYKRENRREKNKLRKLRKLYIKQQNNDQLKKRIKDLENSL